ncbi:MAG TPA: toll/interleukin-1 receptor domain-containing protein [Nitrospira sp.]|nr:toll/interleukin-1 receptor domain-containing protein [Nitrospira sp.]
MLSLLELRGGAARYRSTLAKSLTEARIHQLPTVFLCHSHLDQDIVKGLMVFWREAGWEVYVDWEDDSMPESPTSATAQAIKKRIVEMNYFVFLATPNSLKSRWCPWEIGFADARKDNDRILLIPTTDGYSNYGSEYLGLYRHLDFSEDRRLCVWQPGQTKNGILLESLKR